MTEVQMELKAVRFDIVFHPQPYSSLMFGSFALIIDYTCTKLFLNFFLSIKMALLKKPACSDVSLKVTILFQSYFLVFFLLHNVKKQKMSSMQDYLERFLPKNVVSLLVGQKTSSDATSRRWYKLALAWVLAYVLYYWFRVAHKPKLTYYKNETTTPLIKSCKLLDKIYYPPVVGFGGYMQLFCYIFESKWNRKFIKFDEVELLALSDGQKVPLFWRFPKGVQVEPQAKSPQVTTPIVILMYGITG
ncbi:hypothetical protein RFI_04132, partial [Reticulomyxa filosa]